RRGAPLAPGSGCVRRLGRHRALLDVLPEQPHRRRRAALVLRRACRARAHARLPRLLRRGVLRALVRRAAGLCARGRRPHERRRVQHAVDALRSFRPTVGTAPHEFVQRASIAAWSDDDHVADVRELYARKRAVLLPALERAGLRLAGSDATFYLWVDVDGPSIEFAKELLDRGVVCAPGAFFGPAGEGYVRFALVPTLEQCERAAAILS